MTIGIFVLLSAAGGIGAALRFVVDGLVNQRLRSRLPRSSFPWATIIINTTGSFALGLVTGWVASQFLTTEWSLVLGTGLLGGYTTFSTNSYETVQLLRERHYLASLSNAVGTLVICVGAAALGYGLGA